MSLPTYLVFIVAAFQFMLLNVLIFPLPAKARKGLLRVLLESAIFARVIYFLKICCFFIFILFVDSANTVYKISFKGGPRVPGETLDGGEPAVSGSMNMAARKVLAERNLSLTATTLFLFFLLYRVFHLNIEIVKLWENEAIRQGKDAGPSIKDAAAHFGEMQSDQTPDFHAKAEKHRMDNEATMGKHKDDKHIESGGNKKDL